MKITWPKLLMLVFGFPFVLAAANVGESQLPPLETILTRVKEQAEKEGEQERMFKQQYTYTRTRITEYRNGDGELTKREEKTATRKNATAQTASASKRVAAEKSTSDVDETMRQNNFNRDDLLLQPDIIDRFNFTVVGRESVNGRSALIVEFKPADKKLPERSLKDRFINKAAGRVWVDEEDYVLSKVDVHLTDKVSVLGGLVGSVGKFLYTLNRERTADGLWFNRSVNWHLEGRQIGVRKIVDRREEKTGVRKVATKTVAAAVESLKH